MTAALELVAETEIVTTEWGVLDTLRKATLFENEQGARQHAADHGGQVVRRQVYEYTAPIRAERSSPSSQCHQRAASL